MNDFYGKSTGIFRRRRLSERLISKARSIFSDLAHLEQVFSKRPLLIPAGLLLLCSFLSYLAQSIVPAILMCVLVISIIVINIRTHKDLNVLFAGILICCMLIYSGFSISSKLNAVANTGTDEFSCRVTSVSHDLSGDLDVVARLDGGAYCVLKYYGTEPVFASIRTGDCLSIYGKLKVPEKAGNPGEFDYREYLKKQGISYVLTCDSVEIVGRAGFPVSLTGYIQDAFFNMRKTALNTVCSRFDKSSRALAAAVCSGDKSLISDDVRRDFKMSCCSHLLAVSGTHFAGFLVCLPMILNAFKLKRKSAFLVHSMFCILIGCMTGWSDSVTRAAIMSICVFAGRDWLSALSLASVVMTLADPFCPLSSGFQMSFCAVVGIKVYSPKVTSVLKKLHLGEGISNMFSAAICAGLGMIPFWSDISMRPDPLHLLIQIAGTFIAGICCTFFVPCVLLCGFLPFWSQYLSSPLLLCIKTLRHLISFGCELSEKGGAPVHLSKTFLIVLAFSVFLFFMPPSILKRLFFKLSCIVLAVMIGFNIVSVINRPDCRVVFADVGQGDCCLIMTRDKTCLIDGGTYEEGASTVSDLLDYYGIWQVDLCVMSHWDVDHAGGIAALCVQGRTKSILTSYVPGPSDSDKDVEDFFKSTGLNNDSKALYMSQLSLCLAGDRIMLSDTVFLDVLYPSSGTGGGNEQSLVAKLHISGSDPVDILFTGDIGQLPEAQLIEESADLDCDILKVAHHGSKYSSSDHFIAACSPSIAVISVGAHNFYGHPAPATLERLEKAGCTIFRTDQEGAVVLEY